jgi:dTDP-4-amino-4,6-dideoxygalactose transaminase
MNESSNDSRSHLIDKLRDYYQENNILLTPSGRCGLYLLLTALDHKRVIIPAYTCKAVAEAAILAGKEIVYVDVEDDEFNMSLSAFKKSLIENSIVIATHQFGIPCAIEEIVKLCHEKGAVLIEDAAPSLGTRVHGKLTGTFGDASFFSFDSTKLIHVPIKGGFVIVKDLSLFEKVKEVSKKELKPMPLIHKYKLLILASFLIIIENPFMYRIFHTLYFQLRGRFTEDSNSLSLQKSSFYIYQFSNWQAVIALKQFNNINHLIKTRKDLYDNYRKSLSGSFSFSLPPEDTAQEWACIRFPIRIKGNKMSFYKKAVRLGVDFSFSFTYPPCPKEYTKSQELAGAVLNLPFYQKLTQKEIRRVISVLRYLDQGYK